MSSVADLEALLAELTLEEKAALCHGRDSWTINGCDRVGIPTWTVSDGPIGVRGRTANPTACFPSASAMAATFDLALVGEVGAAIAAEARAKRVQVVLGPTVNLHRHPVTGRHFECYSEDPELTAQVAVAYVRGVQAGGVGACIKHYVANDQEHERFTISADVDERTLREAYLVPFEAAVAEAGVRSVMGAYNFVNGVHACAHHELLVQVLKGEWGFDGVVISDWGALKDGVGPGRFGLDVEMPGPGAHWGHGKLAELVRSGEVPEPELDDKVRRILAFLDWCGQLEDPAGEDEEALDTPEQRAVALRAATASLVLLANDGLLPLDPAGLRSVAVIGPNAERTAVLGGGSATVLPYRQISVLDGLRAALGDGVAVRHEAGCSIERAVPPMTEEVLGPELLTVEVFGAADGSGPPVEVHERQGAQILLGPSSWPGVEPPLLVRVTGTFTASEGGTWRLAGGGLHHARLHLDGEPATDNQGPDAFGAGLGNHMAAVECELEAGQQVALRLDYDLTPGIPLAICTLGAQRLGRRLDEEREAALEAAASAADDADVAIVVVGSNDEWESEGADRADLSLPGDQDELVARVARANPRTVVVHNAGAPMLMPWIDDVAAVLQVWYPGQEAGTAIASVLLGDADPSGRMPTTWPKRLEDAPAYAWYPGTAGHVEYGEGLSIGHRWYAERGIEPLWWFGHGLSYTTFEWSAAAATREAATVQVTNTGDRTGTEVVQAYLRPAGPATTSPGGGDGPVLAGFAKVSLEPGETTTVTVALSPRAFRRWDVDAHGWTAAPGPHELRLARSAGDVVATVELG